MRRLLPAALLLLPGTALAQAIDFSKGGSIEVTSRDGMEWRQNEQQVIAQGQARAVRGDVTVTADRLTARYRRRGAPTASAAGATPAAATPGAPGADTGNNEIYRLEADGHVRIFTPTDIAVGDHAVYDIDQAVLLMTGGDMKLTTPQQVLTARDTMEYWSQKRMAVGRGLATVTTADGRRLAADTLVGYTTPPDAPGAPAAKPSRPGGDPLLASGKLQRIEGFGHVEVRTATETIRGDRGVYVADTGIARLAGDVRITRGQSQLNGDEALVNMRTGISTLSRNPGKRVEGLVVPNDAAGGAPDPKKPPAAGKAAPP